MNTNIDMQGPCERQQELIAEVQRHLQRISELSKKEVGVIAKGIHSEWLALDKEIEAELGEKERSLGSLKEHQEEHGC